MLLTGPGRLRGIGCMRLSTRADRDDDESVRVIHAALDAGFRFFDTADAYAIDASDAGHNERLIARALATWGGDRSQVVVATKGGLTRPGGNWVADGRARHLAAACDASRRALGVERIQLYQLHAPDPHTPLATSVRALDSLRRDGLIEAIGLCNVNLGQIEEARQITDIATVQVELSVWHDEALLDGVAEYLRCQAHSAHRASASRRRAETAPDGRRPGAEARRGGARCDAVRSGNRLGPRPRRHRRAHSRADAARDRPVGGPGACADPDRRRPGRARRPLSVGQQDARSQLPGGVARQWRDRPDHGAARRR